MAKQLNISLGFTADTSQAIRQLQELSSMLGNLAKIGFNTSSLGLDKELAQAISKASELKAVLDSAINVQTGKLDLTRFNEGLNKSGTNLKQYAAMLYSLGPAGQQAFNQLALAINQAEIPLKRTNGLLQEFAITLKNTARWQLSSSILHGFMSSLQKAYSYSQDLNRSLNDIRIVSGQSADQMAIFAEKANKAAKQLSVTTNAYTKGALVYYQQGLDDQQVKERTDITMKMANVSQQSAEIVSDQLTAVWNNFAKGGENLEHFADAMVRLGADTASSSDEIAEGLEKFAAIGDTVGLSFDNAAAALATVTATTRQSADVVGTAFKTLFARIQDLELGDTLEDGTTLGKYSEALNAVGINIKDQSGNLKDMDIILDEMGNKWTTLSKDQQVALAQTVAGTRQYTQLIALMDNFDFYQKNLQSAINADGSLQEQADIYAESWEAASKRVRAAAEDIWSSLLDDNFFIKITDGFAKFLNIIDNTIDGLGGLKGVLALLGTVIFKVFSQDISSAIERFSYNIQSMTKSGREKLLKAEIARKQEVNQIQMSYTSDGSLVGGATTDVYFQQAKMRDSLIEKTQELAAKGLQLNEIDQARIKIMMDQVQLMGDEVIEAAKLCEKLDLANEKSEQSVLSRMRIAAGGRDTQSYQNASGNLERAKDLQIQSGIGRALEKRFNETLSPTSIKNMGGAKETLKSFKQYLKDFKNSLKDAGYETDNLNELLDELGTKTTSITKLKEGVEEFRKGIDFLEQEANYAFADIEEEALRMKEAGNLSSNQYNGIISALDKLQAEYNESGGAIENYITKLKSLGVVVDETGNIIINSQGQMPGLAESFVSLAGAISSLTMGISSLIGLWDTWNNEDISFGDKLLTTLTTLGMVLPMIISSFAGVTIAQLGTISASLGAAMGFSAETVAAYEAAAATGTLTVSLWVLLAPILLIVAAIGAAIVIIWGIVKAFQAWQAASPEGQLKALHEETERATEAFNRMEEKITDVKNSLNDLDSGYDKIKELKEGTLEWYEAISEVNNKILGILDVYPELAQYISNKNNLLSISEEGKSYLGDQMTSDYLKASNNKISAQIREKQQEIEVISNKYKGFVGSGKKEDFAFLQDMYKDPFVGDNLFTDTGIRMAATSNMLQQGTFLDIMNLVSNNNAKSFTKEEKENFINSLPTIDWGNSEELKRLAYEKLGESYDTINFSELSKQLEKQKKGMKDTLELNKENIQEYDKVSKEIDLLQKSQFEGALKQIGSNRKSEEAQRLLDNKNYTDYKQQAKGQIEGEIGWQKHFNYSGDENWIKDFMKLQGADEYIAQRNGKMVLEINGEEKEFSKNEVFNGLIDSQATQNLENELSEKLKGSISIAFGKAVEDLNNLDFSGLTTLDNFALGLKDSLSQSFTKNGILDEKILDTTVQNLTQYIGKYYDSLEDFQNSISYIPFDDSEAQKKILELSQAFQNGKIDVDAFKASVDRLNETYKLDSMTDYFLEVAQGLGLEKDAAAEAAGEMQQYAKHLMEIAEESDLISDELADNAEMAADWAKEVYKMNKGIEDLADGIDEWADIIKKSAKESMEFVEAITSIKSALSDILDVNAELISDDFVSKNIEQIKEAANGSETAIDSLREKLSDQIIMDLTINAPNSEEIQNLDSQLENMIANLPDIEIEAKVNTDDFLQAANEIVTAANMTADQANAYFAKMGYEPVYSELDVEDANTMQMPQGASSGSFAWSQETLQQPITLNLPVVGETQIGSYSIPAGFQMDTSAEDKGAKDAKAGAKLIAFSGDGTPPEIKGFRKKAPSLLNNYSSKNPGGNPSKSGGKKGGGGGKSSKPKTVQKKAPIEAKQAKDEIERYHEITKQIDNQSKLLDRLSKAKDAAYGPDKLKMMDKEIEATKTLIDLNKQHIKEIRENLKLDKERAKSYGITFDKNGLINNFDEIIQQKMDEWEVEQNAILAREYAYDAAKNADENYDADGSIKLAIELDKKAIDENYENFKDAISQYEETYELFNEKAAELAEKYREISQQELEKIQYKVQLKLDFNDLERQFIEVEQTLLGDGWEKFSEAVWLADQNIKTFTSDMEANKNGLISLLEQYNNGMDSAVFFEGAKELISNGLGNIKDILSADADMLNMYGDALDKANEEVSRWTDLIDAGTSKLDHFKELSSLLRKDEDNKWMNTILSAQQKTLNDRYNVSKNQFEMLKGEYNALYDRWNREKDTLPEKELEMLETKLYAAVSAMNEAEDQMLSDLEAVGEKAQEILENNISKAQKKLEKNLFGDTYENYMDQIDKLNLKQEEYLTNTNKMYETNKLIRQAQQDIDKTNNNRAKQQYNDYVKYIEQLQESGKLSNYELSIAQARYEVLKAQIALEDAKDAKDQVRLTRDSEGNFGYVYTANQDKVESVQQDFEDAQNKLYNIGLDGAKDYQAKSAEIYEKWQSEMQNIQEQYQSGQIASESEFREKQKEITTYYQGLLKQYNELYYTGYNLLVEESYDNTADYMLKGTISVSDFKDATGDYLSDIRRYYKDYDSTVEEIEETVGSNLSSLKKKTGEVTTNTENLSNMITDKLLPAMSDELEAVRVKTSEYGAQRDAIWEVIEATRELLRLTQKNEMSVLSGNIDDYSLKIRDLLIEGKDENSPLVQQAIANRNSKMNGYDPYDYQAMMDEEAAKNGTNTAWYRTLALLRKQKLLNTDWMGKYNENPEANSWALDVREESMGIDFAQQLINLGNAFPGITTDDDRVRNILNKRKAKLMDLEAKGTNLSGYEPIASLLKRANIIDVSRDGYSPTALYNTGGYTGAWGPEGKLAVLHEKELVLNAQDTENILSSVNILRQISQALDNSAVWASLGLGGLNAASIGTLADQTLQQEVHISADFPNVTDHNEIEMAIDNLINAASQYAYRR